MSVQQWISDYKETSISLQQVFSTLRERKEQITKQGYSPQNCAEKHAVNRRNFSKVESRVNELEARYRELLKSGFPTQLDSSTMAENIESIKRSVIEAKALFESTDGRIYRKSGNVFEEEEGSRAMSGEEMLEYQERQRESQDKMLDDLHTNIQRNIQLGKEMEKEMDKQDKKMDDIVNKSTAAQKEMKKQVGYMDKLINEKIMVFYVFIILMLILIIVQVSTNNFGMGYPKKK